MAIKAASNPDVVTRTTKGLKVVFNIKTCYDCPYCVLSCSDYCGLDHDQQVYSHAIPPFCPLYDKLTK